MQSELPSLLEENWRFRKLMTEGMDVEYYDIDDTLVANIHAARQQRDLQDAAVQIVPQQTQALSPPGTSTRF